MAVIVFKKAEEIDPEDADVQAELADVTTTIQAIRTRYGDDRRAELEGRIKEYGMYGLTQPQIDLLWDVGIMPWDNFVPVSFRAYVFRNELAHTRPSCHTNT